jgi:hypothetical protein
MPFDFLGGTIAHNQNPTPQDAAFTNFAVSPGYRSDRTVFASGTLIRGCLARCPVLFSSTDGAATWNHLPAVGFAGGTILLPPAYPVDRTIFAVGVSGLQRSVDGGATFTTIVPGVTSAAVVPGTAAGQTKIMLGTVPLVSYSDATGLLSPGPVLPTGAASVDALAYVGSGTNLVIAAEGADPAAQGQIDALLGTCDPLQCTVSATFPGQRPTLVVPSPTASIDRTVAVLVGGSIAFSRDGGATFRFVPLRAGAQTTSVGLDPTFATTGVMFAVQVRGLPSGVVSKLLRTADDAATFRAMGTTGLPELGGLTSVAPLPDGRLLVGLALADLAGDLGVRCSTDGGASWASGCT